MEDTKIFLELSPGQEETLADNEMGIEDILDHHNLQVERVTTEQRPYQSEQGVQTKDLVTTIIAGSVAITALAMAISQVLTTLQQKPTIVTAYNVVEFTNADGTSETKLIESPALLEPKGNAREITVEAGFKLLGIQLKFSSK